MTKEQTEKSRPQDWLHPELLAAAAYEAPRPPPGVLRLDAMESPWNCASSFAPQWQQLLAETEINRYPDAKTERLSSLLRAQLEIPEHSDILTGNGSDELIALLINALGGMGRTIVSPAPSFSMYEILARSSGSRFLGIPLRRDFSLDTEQMCRAVSRPDVPLCFLALPNNPTGNLFALEAIEQIIDSARGLVILDQAYSAFCQRKHQQLLAHPQVMSLGTLSKVGLAGLRIGYLAGAPDWIGQLGKLRLPYCIGTLNEAAACYVLEHYPLLLEQAERICRARETLYRQLQQIEKLEVWPSEANFLLLRPEDAETVYQGLLAQKILVKKLHGSHPLLHQCLRLTIGSPAENQQFLDALKNTLD